MRTVDILKRDGSREAITTYDIYDFPYHKLEGPFITMSHKRHGVKGIHKIFATFDIETTTITNSKYKEWLASGKKKELEREDAPQGFMYHWQMCIGGLVVTGRYWEEWVEFMLQVKEILHINREWVLVCYIHNAGYEFQFMRDFLSKHFGGYSVFANQPRKPIYIRTGIGFEFRCSYKLTNMSLEKASEFEREVVHIKAKGDLDYSKLRTPTTPLDDEEFGYCVSDVVSLYEIILSKMHSDCDTLETIPMTSTGYVRRDCRKACRKDPHYRQNVFLKNRMTKEVYIMLKEAGRGGNTHANRFMSGRVWTEANSFDEVSGYPAVQLLFPEFPITSFMPYGAIESQEEFRQLMGEYACLFHVVFGNLRVKKNIPMPYIPIAKGIKWSTDVQLDNGRVLSSSAFSMCVTNIDFEIIELEYEWDDMYICDMHIARKGYLPKTLREVIHDYFCKKCELKEQIQALEDLDVLNSDQENELEDLTYLYGKIKNKLNGIFGCTYSDPVRDTITIDPDSGEWNTERPTDELLEEALDKYHMSRNSFLVYAWGVYTTALNRRHLENLLQATGGYGPIGEGHRGAVIYCDTDSSKCVDTDFELIEKLNKDIIALNEKTRSYCDVNGKRFYLGLYEKENKKPIAKFKTLGAKKYAYEDEHGFHITVSGVNKKLGATEMGSIDNFTTGFIFKDAGGSTLYYNDDFRGIHKITVNGETFTTASNIGMVASTYELGITDEYAELIGYNFYNEIDKGFNKV